MISIVNIGPDEDSKHDDARIYRMSINTTVIGEFRHRRSHGLAACLRIAAECAEMAQADAMVETHVAARSKP